MPVPALALLFLLGSRASWSRPHGAAPCGRRADGRRRPGVADPVRPIPSADRPYPMGSTNGSIWDTVFVYNGIGRLDSTSTRQTVDHLSPPGVTRLLAHGPLHLDLLIGVTLFAAIAFAIAAAVLGVARRRSVGRLPLALAIAMGTWLVIAAAVLSSMRHMPLRYLEPLNPAIAAVFGIAVGFGVRAAVRSALRHGRPPSRESLARSPSLRPWARPSSTRAGLGRSRRRRSSGPSAAAAVLGAARVAVVDRGTAARLAAPVTGLVAAFVLLAVLAVPTVESFALVRARTGDGGELGHMPARNVAALSAFLTRHRDHRRYEFASLNAALAGPLIVADDQPVLILAGWPPHPLVSARGLRHAVRAGEVRYVLLSARGSDLPSTRPRRREPLESGSFDGSEAMGRTSATVPGCTATGSSTASTRGGPGDAPDNRPVAAVRRRRGHEHAAQHGRLRRALPPRCPLPPRFGPGLRGGRAQQLRAESPLDVQVACAARAGAGALLLRAGRRPRCEPRDSGWARRGWPGSRMSSHSCSPSRSPRSSCLP